VLAVVLRGFLNVVAAGPGFRDRGDRGFERGERREPRGGGFGGERDQGPMQSFRLEVGRVHDVRAGSIVGAIAGESGLGQWPDWAN
jgi:hypothetical protein